MAEIHNEPSVIHQLVTSALSQLCLTSLTFKDSVHVTGELKFNIDALQTHAVFIDENVKAFCNWEIFNDDPNKDITLDGIKKEIAEDDNADDACNDSYDQTQSSVENVLDQLSEALDNNMPINGSITDSSDKEISSRNSIKPTNSRSRKIKNKDKPFGCGICMKTFLDKYYLEKHIASHDGITEVADNIIYHKGETPFKCSICGEGFHSKQRRKLHVQTHISLRPQTKYRKMLEKPFGCKMCGKAFVEKDYLKHHITTKHEDVEFTDNIIYHKGATPFRCALCGVEFSRKLTWRLHMQSHTGKKEHLCNICGKSFSKVIGMRAHMQIHDTVEKPFKCHLCDRSYVLSSMLSNHMVAHLEKQHQCETCGNSFTRKNELQTHIRTHTGEKPYHCAVCGKAFVTSSAFTVHRRIHTGEKPYKCSLCSKAFHDKDHLNKHTSIHAGVKPYECQECGKAFNLKGNLKQHMRTHAKLKEPPMETQFYTFCPDLKYGHI